MATTKNITMKQFNGTDYDTLYPKTVYNQVSGVAPAGYGLGGIGTKVTDLNDAQESGFYSAFGAANLPPNVESAQYGSVLVLCSQKNRVTQVYFNDVTGGTGAIAVRRLNGNGWSAWEFINPPTKLGVEYRTVERYNEKPVYAKMLNFGALPNSTSKSFAHGISSLGYVVDIYGQGVAGQDVKVGVDTTNITITSTSNLSAVTAYPVIKYTKTTD